MSCRVRFTAAVSLAAAMGLIFAAAQNTPTFPSPVQLEPATAGIEVEVVDPVGALILNAKVTLIDPDGNRVLNSVTDSNGRVRFPNQPAGSYAVLVESKGFKTVRLSVDVPTHRVIRVMLPLYRGGGGPVTCTSCDVPTTTSSLENRLPPDPSPGKVTHSPVPRRNPVARFFSGIRHKLGF